MISRYQLMNTLLNENRRIYNPNEVWTEHYSRQQILELMKLSTEITVEEVHYCCYGNTQHCWVDVEGEGFGWIWIDEPEDKWHDLLSEYVKEILKDYGRYLHNKKVIKIWDEENWTNIIILPLRDKLQKDIYIRFKMVEIKTSK